MFCPVRIKTFKTVLFACFLTTALILPNNCMATEPVELHTDVCVVGGGSGGIGAALAASRAGAEVILIEKQAKLGGTSTLANVNSWEPGPGCSFAREIYDRLKKIPKAVKIPDAQGKKRSYEDTLRRAGLPRSVWQSASVQFEVDPFCRVVTGMLDETGKCKILLNTKFTKSKADGNRVVYIEAESSSKQRYKIFAKVFVDSTGGGHLCKSLGCEMMLGAESKQKFNEPSAPDKPFNTLNSLELCYRIRRSDKPKKEPPPQPPMVVRGGYAYETPDGDKIVNPCGGLLPGWDLIALGYDGAMAKAKRRAHAHWHWMQRTKYPNYEFDSFPAMLGIRESWRVVGEYVLSQHDLIAGLKKQSHPDIIAIADHAVDVHGAGGGCGELKTPYGIPYRCLIPKGWTNLLVACRGASFSHIAASSCRLSRTMIAIGHAAGLAAAKAAKSDSPAKGLDIRDIQKDMRMPPK
ncbi:MAG: FAD-dependent oxidoreductase [Pirellulales bacterium]|nr:FAD-dependent oxidoreductase [Pirellulales bacterium]